MSVVPDLFPRLTRYWPALALGLALSLPLPAADAAQGDGAQAKSAPTDTAPTGSPPTDKGGESGGGGQAAFNQCIANLKTLAREDGIPTALADRVLDQVTYKERVIELDRDQPEFTQTFTDYLSTRVTPGRVERGRALLEKHKELLERVERETGVPGHYLVAFWGLETNFGSTFGNISVPSSLATLACDERRSDYFTNELINALHILDEGAISLEKMEGSWAGAMGHVQFMPSVFLRYAVDGDGDGKRDLWGSIPDAMASAGNFLENLGWVRGLRWGREVMLPEPFSYALAGKDQAFPLSEWVEFGVRDAFGDPLPPLENIEASLLLPSGHRGPAFLVYENFDVIMGWNRSHFYALAVGILADRIAGAAPLQTPPPEDEPRLTRDQIRKMQVHLNNLGFEAGEADGILGPQTRHALSRFQRAEDLIADGYPNEAVLEAMGIAMKDKAAAAETE